MKEAFISKRFNTKSQKLLTKIIQITEDYAADNLDLSLRQLFYVLTDLHLIPKTVKGYKNLGNLITDARLTGLIDWDVIRDRSRTALHSSHCDDITKVVNDMKWGFKVDMWQRQAHYIEVFVEKQSLEGVLEPVCYDMDVTFTSNKGYSSSSAVYDASKRYLAAAELGKKLHIIYLGDHDPSGIDMSRDIDDRFNRFMSTVQEGFVHTDDELNSIDPRPYHLNRLALNMDQVRKLHLQSSPSKPKDLRLKSYVQRFKTKKCWELAAIEPRKMAKLVKDSISSLIDFKIWDEDKAREDKARAELQQFSDDYNNPPPMHVCPTLPEVREYDPQEF